MKCTGQIQNMKQKKNLTIEMPAFQFLVLHLENKRNEVLNVFKQTIQSKEKKKRGKTEYYI